MDLESEIHFKQIIHNSHILESAVTIIIIYSGGKKNPDLLIKSTENLNMTCRHCKRLVIIMLSCVYTVSYMK